MDAAREKNSYDVVIIGGALAGASAAILLLREEPSLRILILEKSAAFGRRVGEATVEISGYFLCRVLGLTQYLNEAHLVKQGMRFWFSNGECKTLADCSEIGGKYLSRVPSFQVDRAALDEEVLQRAKELGAEIWRPASAGKVQLNPGGEQTVEVKFSNGNIQPPAEQTACVSARWVLDASGVAALLARQNGWWQPNKAHPTTAAWSRWSGVKDWDGCELAKKFPDWAKACHGIRSTATNHLVGHGWWAWIIPLKGGDVSVGVVFDQRLVKWPEGGALAERLKKFLMQHPVGKEILADAQWHDGDVHWRQNLAYFSTRFAGDGYALVGDAAAFLDPFYSPGMDGVSFTVWSATRLILAQRHGENIASRIEKHNRDFARSYDRWFQAVYQDKYEYLGDYDLMRIGFRLDLGLYYLGVASQPYKLGTNALTQPPFSTPPSVPFFYFMRFYNRRFAKMARMRKRRSEWGRKNAGRRLLIPGFTFSPKSSWPLVKALCSWARLELTEGWRSWFAFGPRSSSEIKAATAMAVTR